MERRSLSAIRRALAFFQPRERVSAFDWSQRHIRDFEGHPYRSDNYPHLHAKNGPFDAFDDPTVRRIWLQFGSRLGKTFFGQCALMKTAQCNPCQMMFASQSEKLALEVTDRTYRMLDKCHPLKSVVKPERARRQDFMDLGPARVYVAWARSVTTLADKAVKVGHANEIDKWEYLTTSKEGDPLKLFTERGKQYPDHKFILEGTPTIHLQSRIERGFLGSDRRRLYVPCPHCGEHQVLRFGKAGEPGGIQWDKSGERSDIDEARETARYVCKHCEGRIENHHRKAMIQKGVWLREGETVDPAGKVSGQPIRRGPDAGFQLSSLYSVPLNWGDIVAEFLASCDRPALLRNFVNGWLGETFDPYTKQSKPEQVGQRLRGTHRRGVVPVGGVYLTVGVDKQRSDGGFLVYTVLAHGEDGRTWLVDYGTTATFESLYTIITRKYEHADGRWAISPALTLIDSGDDTAVVYAFCKAHEGEGILPCKGKDAQGGDEAFSVAELGEHGEKGLREAGKKAIGQIIIHVNTDYTEEDLQRLLEDSQPGEPQSLSLCEEASNDLEFLEQLCNGVKGEKLTKRNVVRSLWMKRDEHQPNDWRDSLRYGLTARGVYLASRSGVAPARQAPPAPVLKKSEPQRRGRMALQRR